jgi:DNA-binding response OmpR family regulator
MMLNKRLLLVEDDRALADLVTFHFERAGYDVTRTGDGEEALILADEIKPDVILLDWMIEGISGIEVCRRLRDDGNAVPIIMLTARGTVADRIEGLDVGADDYMVKPFTGAHLDARITTVLRRVGRASRTAQPAVHEVGDLRVDIGERSASLGDTALALTRKEFDLLAYLAARPGRVVSRRELLEEVWRQPSVGEDQTIDVHLYWLRRKLGESAAKPRYLRTVRGVGFRLVAPD